MRRRPQLLALFFLSLLCLGAAGEKPTVESPEEFIAGLAEALAALDPPIEIRRVDELEVLAVRGRYGSRLGIQRPYDEYVAEPQRRSELIEKLVRMARTSLEGLARPPAPDRIVPVVKREDWLQERPYDGPLRELPAGLVAVLAEDRPETFSYLSSEDVEQLGVPVEVLWETSLENLAALAPVEVEKIETVLFFTSGGNYEASLLLDPELVKIFEKRLGTGVVFAVPRHDLFLMTSREDFDGYGRLAAAVCGAATPESPGALTSRIFGREKGELNVVAEVSCDGPVPRWESVEK